MQIKFKKLHPAAVAPKQGTPGSAGFDLTIFRAEHFCPDYGHFMVRYRSGIAIEIPRGFVGLLFPRSSVCKTSLRMSNAVGVIDSDYRGEITGIFDSDIPGEHEYNSGDRFAQLVIVPVPEVEYIEAEELTPTDRGAGGYGSTGR